MSKKYDLKEKRIGDLERELEYREKEYELKAEKVRIQEKEARMDIEKQLQTANVRCEQLQARIDEHPYKQLTELLKAIAVKLPELNIKELAVHTKEK